MKNAIFETKENETNEHFRISLNQELRDLYRRSSYGRIFTVARYAMHSAANLLEIQSRAMRTISG
jgi:hypothetical protein